MSYYSASVIALVSCSELVVSSSYHSAGVDVYVDAYDSASSEVPGLYNGYSTVYLDWDESAAAVQMPVILYRDYTCDADGVCVVTDVDPDKVISVVPRNGIAKVTYESGYIVVSVYEYVTGEDKWVISDDMLYHYHYLRPVPYAVIRLFYLP